MNISQDRRPDWYTATMQYFLVKKINHATANVKVN